MLLDSFEVENFRSLKHLKLEKLARVNLLVGKNNSGKTSVLEALTAIHSFGDTSWLSLCETERGLIDNRADFKYLFYGFDASSTIRLAATHRDPVSNLIVPSAFLTNTIKLQERSKERSKLAKDGIYSTIQRSGALSLLTMVEVPGFEPEAFEVSRLEHNEFYVSSVSGDSSTSSSSIALEFPATSRYGVGEILTTTIDRQLLSRKVEQLKFDKRDAPMLSVMQAIDSRIQSIELGAGGQIYFDLGDKFRTLLPINLMGEGIQRLLDISSAIADKSGRFVFIDEIDNGLHYSALRVLWKGILQAAREYDVQVFATTHSAEALRHLTWVLDEEENEQYRDDVAAYTLIRAKDDTVKSYRYNYGQLEFALERGIEVRN